MVENGQQTPADSSTILSRMLGRFPKYLAAAFGARPKGMFIPPNWVGLGVFALLGTLNPGLWLVGAGLELAYLFTMVSSAKFRNIVDGRLISGDRQGWTQKVDRLLAGLDSGSQMRYRALEERCRGMVKEPSIGESDMTRQSMSEALGQLVWVYLQLLVTKQATVRLVQEGQGGVGSRRHIEPLGERKAELERRLKSGSLDADLRRSLEGQLDLLNQRMESQREAAAKIDFIDAELARVEEQVQLVREQAVLADDPDAASRRIDAIQSTLGGTTQWIRDQKRISGDLADALEGTPPPVLEMGSEQSR